jgi:hypothetical protein
VTDPIARPDFLSIFREFENKTAMFPGTKPAKVDQFAAYIVENAGRKQEKPSTDLATFVSKPASPQSIRNFAEGVTEGNARQYFPDLNQQLDQTEAKNQGLLLEVTCHILRKGKAFASAFIDANTLEHVKWDVPETADHLHRLICEVVYQNNKVFSSGIFLKMISNAAIAQPAAIVHAVSAFLQGCEHGSEFQAVFDALLQSAQALARAGAAPSYAQLLYFMYTNHEGECRQIFESFCRAVYYVLVSNSPRAIHTVYTMYATFFRGVDWPMDDPVLLGHIGIPQVRYVLLSYLVRSYTPQKPDFVEPLLKIVGDYPALAGLVLCRMAKLPGNHKAFLVDNMNWLKQVQPLVGIRLLFLVAGTPGFRTAFSQFLTVYTFLSGFVTRYPGMLLGVATLVLNRL